MSLPWGGSLPSVLLRVVSPRLRSGSEPTWQQGLFGSGLTAHRFLVRFGGQVCLMLFLAFAPLFDRARECNSAFWFALEAVSSSGDFGPGLPTHIGDPNVRLGGHVPHPQSFFAD